MWCLPSFGVDELESCSAALRGLGADAESMEAVAGRVVEVLHDGLVDEAGEPATALVRFYKTHRYGDLPAELRDVAGEVADRQTPCLTLLGTTGTEAAWRDRRRSANHQAIPLASKEAVARLPMVSRLFADMGVDLAEVAHAVPAEAIRLHHRSYDVFYVPDAVGSPWVPAQDDFVVPYGIRSVVGLGGALPSGDVFAVILFATVAVPEPAADLLRSLAPAIKAAVVPVTYRAFA